MRSIRIFQEGPFEAGQITSLTPEAGQHVGVVLRMQPDDTLILFCGDNHEYQARITEVHKKRVTVIITAVSFVNRESPRAIHLAQAISKGDRMEWVIQKAVELGVARITPLITAHCAVRLDDARLIKKQLQWQAIAVAACEQCGRNKVPMIAPTVQFDPFIQHCQSPLKLILHPTASMSWHNMPSSEGEVTLLIGPEGGLSNDEIKRAEAQQFNVLLLGPRILRTETAAIAALSILQARLGDL